MLRKLSGSIHVRWCRGLPVTLADADMLEPLANCQFARAASGGQKQVRITSHRLLLRLRWGNLSLAGFSGGNHPEAIASS